MRDKLGYLGLAKIGTSKCKLQLCKIGFTIPIELVHSILEYSFLAQSGILQCIYSIFLNLLRKVEGISYDVHISVKVKCGLGPTRTSNLTSAFACPEHLLLLLLQHGWPFHS